MKNKSPAKALIAVSLLSLSACAGRQTPKSTEGTLRVSIVHASSSFLFEDVIDVEGKTYPVGSGRGGELEIALAPGPHAVRVSSTRLRHVATPVDTVDQGAGLCLDVACNFRAPARRTDFEMVPQEEARCERSTGVEIAAGQVQVLRVATLADGTCAP